MAGERHNDNGGRGEVTDARDTLIIGDKNFSSWSLRPWLAMKHFGIPFAEERIYLRQPRGRCSRWRRNA
jgi:hypothetical protein